MKNDCATIILYLLFKRGELSDTGRAGPFLSVQSASIGTTSLNNAFGKGNILGGYFLYLTYIEAGKILLYVIDHALQSSTAASVAFSLL